MTAKKSLSNLLFWVLIMALALSGCGPGTPTPTKPSPIPPIPPMSACIDFETPLVLGTQYGGPVGNVPGQTVFTTQGIPVSVHDFAFVGSGGTVNFKIPNVPVTPNNQSNAKIEKAPVTFGSGQSIRSNNINLEFDFNQAGFQISQVQFEFLDLGGFENLSVNGSPVLAGELSATPSTIGGANFTFSSSPVQGGKKGSVMLNGAVKTLRIGGQELWIDNVCAK